MVTAHQREQHTCVRGRADASRDLYLPGGVRAGVRGGPSCSEGSTSGGGAGRGESGQPLGGPRLSARARPQGADREGRVGPGDVSPATSPWYSRRATQARRDEGRRVPWATGTLPWHPLFLSRRTRWSARPPAPPRLHGALRAARPSPTWLEVLRTRPSLTARLHAPLSGPVLRRLVYACDEGL